MTLYNFNTNVADEIFTNINNPNECPLKRKEFCQKKHSDTIDQKCFHNDNYSAEPLSKYCRRNKNKNKINLI